MNALCPDAIIISNTAGLRRPASALHKDTKEKIPMNHRPSVPASNSRIINGTALGFSILFLLASLATACFVGEWGHVFLDWRRIMISPCPPGH